MSGAKKRRHKARIIAVAIIRLAKRVVELEKQIIVAEQRLMKSIEAVESRGR